MNFHEKSVIIVGGLGGLGSAICQELLAKGLKKLGVIDILTEAEASEKHVHTENQVHYIYKSSSVTEYDTLKRVIEEIKQEFGHLDIIINAAGIANEQNPKKMIDINFLGTVNSTLIGVELMRKDKNEQRGGTIINIASVAALRPTFFLPVYVGTKHAILGFTRSLTISPFYDQTGVKLMVICPGATRTPIINVRDKLLFPEIRSQVMKIAMEMPIQEPEIVAKCINQALSDDENGSVWQCENSHIEKIEMHKYPEFYNI